MYFENDVRTGNYFRNAGNTSEDDVITKISAINDGDVRRFSSVKEMTDHILALNIDKRLAEGDLTLVDIAKADRTGKFPLLSLRPPIAITTFRGSIRFFEQHLTCMWLYQEVQP